MTFESPDGVTTVKPSGSRETDNSVRPSSFSNILGALALVEAAPTDAVRRAERRPSRRDNENRREDCIGSEPEQISVIEHSRPKVWGAKQALTQLSGPSGVRLRRRL